jgi:transcription initiation factor IIE alpha subunit
MKQLNEKDFADFENPQFIWEIYGEILDFYFDEHFSAETIASHVGTNKKLINKILHRLVNLKAISCAKTDHWGVKYYRLNNEFTGMQ